MPRGISYLGSEFTHESHEFPDRWISDRLALGWEPVPVGTYYIPANTPKANPNLANTWTWFSEGTSSYNALQVDLTRRFSHNLSFRGVREGV